jgi:predicted trehalose synthase
MSDIGEVVCEMRSQGATLSEIHSFLLSTREDRGMVPATKKREVPVAALRIRRCEVVFRTVEKLEKAGHNTRIVDVWRESQSEMKQTEQNVAHHLNKLHNEGHLTRNGKQYATHAV